MRSKHVLRTLRILGLLGSFGLFGGLLGGLLGCARSTPVKVAVATRTSVESTVATTSSGTVTAQRQAVLAFSSTGRIASVEVEVGDRVQAGQLLAQLENKDLRAVLQDSESELRRAEKLFQANLLSRKGLDQAQKNFTVAKANLDKTVIRAPFSGLVTEVNLEVGELSQPQAIGGTPPIRLIDLNPRLVKGEIDEIDLPKVKEGDSARVKILAHSQSPIPAVVTRVVPFISTTKEQDRTSQIELRLLQSEVKADRNAERNAEANAELRAVKTVASVIPVGASADIEVVTASKENTLAIPTRSVLGTGDQRYVFAVENGKIQKKPVQLGLGNYDRTEVVSGLEVGMKVVIPSGDSLLKEGMKVMPEDVKWP